MANTVPVQSKKHQSPKSTRYMPPDPALSKGIAAPVRSSTPPNDDPWRPNGTEIKRPYLPSATAESETFMFATRHALEQALGEETLERLEALLQQEKKLTQDYIEYLEETVRQKSGVGSPMSNTLMQKELAYWKAKAEGHDENTKTETGLLRDWNVRIKDEKDKLQDEVERLREENGMLKAETEQLKGAKENDDNDENMRLRIRNDQLEAEKDALNANMQMMLEDFVALKAEVERLKNGSAPAHEQKEPDVEMKESDNRITGNNTNVPVTLSKNHEKNFKKRARAKKRRELIMVQENKQLSTKLAEAESQHATAYAATLAAQEERMEKLQEKIEELQREVRSRDERAEQQHHSPATASVLVAAPTSAPKKRSKKKKKKAKKEQKRVEEMSE